MFKNLKNISKLTSLVENRTIYQSDYAELNIFETYQKAEKVSLQFNYPIIASMIEGKKIMHLENMQAFDFLPGESVVLPAHKEMLIDFPIAKMDEPTRCLALGIDTMKIEEAVYRFNEKVGIDGETKEWSLTENASYHIHDQAVDRLVQRLLSTFTENSASRSMLLDLMIQELIIRLLQSKARASILYDIHEVFSDTRIGSVIKYIKDNLTNKDITVESLAAKACMSVSHFHKNFKNTLGVSPIDYINSEKIKFAKKLMKDRFELQISEIAYLSGFNSISYFNRQFKKLELVTPNSFKQSLK